jgi:hypothetical protein
MQGPSYPMDVTKSVTRSESGLARQMKVQTWSTEAAKTKHVKRETRFPFPTRNVSISELEHVSV